MYMVSMCCEDCKAEKLKSNTLNKMLLEEHCKYISEYLGCDDCSKMNPILITLYIKHLTQNNNKYIKWLNCFHFLKL